MIAKGVSLSILEQAAQKVGVSLEVRTLNQAGTRHNVKVNSLPLSSNYRPGGSRYSGERGDAPYQRENGQTGRRVHAVCWHGFRDLFRAVYAEAPETVFRTAIDTWRGSADFEARFRFSGHRNIGSQMYPVMMADACRCPDRGMAV